MPEVTIDGKIIQVAPGTTILEAARQLGIDIPTICHLQGYEHSTACMACVVAVEGKNKLVPSCASVVQDGMKIRTQGEDLQDARRTAVELLLGDHTGDCIGPCEVACPAGFDVPQYLRLIQKGKDAEAYVLSVMQLVLPNTLGWICPAPCAKACRRKQHDSAVAIPQIHKVLSAALSLPVAKQNDKKIAIVGSGPAGIAAAFTLSQTGYACSVYDRNNEPGGNLLTFVQQGVLPQDVLQKELSAVFIDQTRFIGNCTVNKNWLQKLQDEFDAVLICCGANADGLGISVNQTSAGCIAIGNNLYAAGNILVPENRMAIRSIASGIMAARKIDAALRNCSYVNNKRINVMMGKLDKDEMALLMRNANSQNTLLRNDTLDAQDLSAEAARCLHCDCRAKDNCRLRDTASGLAASTGKYKGERRAFGQDMTHPSIVYEPGKCILCGLCIQTAQRHGEIFGSTFIGRGFDVRVAPPFNELMDSALRIAGNECVNVCPTGALSKK